MRGSGHVIEHDRWMTHPDDVDYLAPADRWCRVCGLPDREHTCSTCGHRADEPYRNAAAGEGCVDPIHDAFVDRRTGAVVGHGWRWSHADARFVRVAS